MNAEDTQPLKDDLEPALSRAGGRCQRYSRSVSPSRGSDTVSVLVQKKKKFSFHYHCNIDHLTLNVCVWFLCFFSTCLTSPEVLKQEKYLTAM